MVPKKSRIPRTGFESQGYRVLRSPYFSVKVKKNDLVSSSAASAVPPANRIAVVVGKSVDKRAVRRNFWKRQAKMQLLKLPPTGTDFILTIYPKTNTLTKEQFAAEIKKILKL
jgi:ribonuclease P protein component